MKKLNYGELVSSVWDSLMDFITSKVIVDQADNYTNKKPMTKEYDIKSIFEFAERKLGKITSMIIMFLIVVLIVVTHYKEIQNQKYFTFGHIN